MKSALAIILPLCFVAAVCGQETTPQLLAGVAKVEISDRSVGPINDPAFVKALVLRQRDFTAVVVTLDAVAIGGIGRIPNDYLSNIRRQIKTEIGVAPENVIVNASHCHSTPRLDTDTLTVNAVKEAFQNLVPVKVGVGVGHEDRISENRRLQLKDASQADMRRAYAMPPDKEVASIGPIDPRVGVVRIDRQDGRPLAVLYHFACHPIMNPPHKGNSADFPGFASRAIEQSTGAIAMFLQGCGGDINPVRYKEVNQLPDAEPLGNQLGLSVLQTLNETLTKEVSFSISSERLHVPRATDFAKRIKAIETERMKIVESLRPTNVNFKSFLPLFLQQNISAEFPSHNAQSYLHDKAMGRDSIQKLDKDNRQAVDDYLYNIEATERLTRLNTNLELLKKHYAESEAAKEPNVEVEICGLRIGSFKLITFPGEVTVQVGLSIQQAANDQHLFVSGYTNGYIYYTPTAQQRLNSGYAQEDCDSIVAPEWQRVFEQKALETLKRLN